MSNSRYEQIFSRQLAEVGLTNFEREVRFNPDTGQRFDFADKTLKLAIEIEGSVWRKGRHTFGQGFMDDCDKYNEAALLGWCVLRIPAPWVAELKGKRLIPNRRGIELAQRAVEVLRD